jgi:tetratricopeptide (TPR) repeat protein
MKRIYFTLLLGLLFQGLHGQTLKAYLKAAENAYAEKNYYSAMTYFGIALEIDNKPPLVWYKLAEAARLQTAYPLADSAYQQVILREELPETRDALYKLAQVKKQLGEYKTAQEHFYEFAAKIAGTNDSLAQRAVAQAEECEWAMDVMDNTARKFAVKSADSVGMLINTPYSEFGAHDFEDKLYFTSFRFVKTDDDYDPPRPYMKILKSENEQAAILFQEINDDSLHTAYLAFDTKRTKVYYSICEYVAVSDIRCKLYSRDYFADKDSLGAPVLLPEPINMPGFTASQPNVGYVDASKKEILFFVSDRPGGKGDTDIWYAEILADGQFGAPENLSAVNSAGSEVTPFFHRPTQTLYFSTDGWKTLGGYDVYKSSKFNSVWSAPEHVAPPINSSFNDVYYWIDDNGVRGYLSSNRDGSIFYQDTREFCCYDIFRFQTEQFNLNILTFNRKTGAPLPAVDLKLFELTASGETKLVDSGSNPRGNNYTFFPDPGKRYILQSSKNDFVTQIDTIDLRPFSSNQETFTHNAYLNPLSADLQTLVFDADTQAPLPGATVQLLENGVPVASVTNEEGHEFFFPIDRTKTYQVLVSRPGYEPQTADIKFDAGKPDFSVVQKVYLKRYELDLTTLVYDKATEEPIRGVTVQLFDPERQIAIKTNNEGNDFKFPIDRRKEYTLVVGKPGYHPDTVQIIPSRYGGPDLTQIIQKVYLLRKELPDFIPLYLYFDNDQPDPRTNATTTKKSYSDTYAPYYNRKNFFIDEYTKVLQGNDRFLAEQLIEAFFEREVRDGYQSLDLFCDQLLNYLEKGATLEITITGFASPRASSRYNLALGSRRIASLLNQFNAYKDGALAPYIQSGKLKIIEVSKGDREVPAEVRKQLESERESIYSPLASRQRRVEIIGVTLGGTR